ncbi:MAG: hypothetical protein V4576_01950 [Patescibacteria group bacterium]
MKLLLSILTILVTPAVTFAQSAPITRSVDGFLNYIIYLAGRALPLLILAAVVLLLYGIVVNFFFQSSDDKRKEGKNFIIAGIVALFVMVSVWGLVNILRTSFNLNNTDVPAAPYIPVQISPLAAPQANPGGNPGNR